MAKKNLTEKTFAKIDDAARAWVKASGGLYRGASGGWIYRVGTRGITRGGVRTRTVGSRPGDGDVLRAHGCHVPHGALSTGSAAGRP